MLVYLGLLGALLGLEVVAEDEPEQPREAGDPGDGAARDVTNGVEAFSGDVAWADEVEQDGNGCPEDYQDQIGPDEPRGDGPAGVVFAHLDVRRLQPLKFVNRVRRRCGARSVTRGSHDEGHSLMTSVRRPSLRSTSLSLVLRSSS